MARIRTIKPEFPQSESMGRISRDARLLFVQLWCICDDHGRTRAASRMLASLLFPYDDDAAYAAYAAAAAYAAYARQKHRALMADEIRKILPVCPL
jgi:hypothetical protein